MKASLVHAIGRGFTLADIEVDGPVGSEVLVDVKASGLCHTDLTFSRHDLGAALPAVFGHEVAGNHRLSDNQQGEHNATAGADRSGRTDLPHRQPGDR